MHPVLHLMDKNNNKLKLSLFIIIVQTNRIKQYYNLSETLKV